MPTLLAPDLFIYFVFVSFFLSRIVTQIIVCVCACACVCVCGGVVTAKDVTALRNAFLGGGKPAKRKKPAEEEAEAFGKADDEDFSQVRSVRTFDFFRSTLQSEQERIGGNPFFNFFGDKMKEGGGRIKFWPCLFFVMKRTFHFHHKM